MAGQPEIKKGLKAGVTVYEGARAFSPGSSEDALPENFKAHAPAALKKKVLDDLPPVVSDQEGDPKGNTPPAGKPGGTPASSDKKADEKGKAQSKEG